MPSFVIMSEVDLFEVANAVQNMEASKNRTFCGMI